MMLTYKKGVSAAMFTALALVTFSVPAEGSVAKEQDSVFYYVYYDKGEKPDWISDPSTFTLSEAQKERLEYVGSYWSSIVGPALNLSTPARVEVFTNNIFNAGAYSWFKKYDSQEYYTAILQGYLLGLHNDPKVATAIVIGQKMFPLNAAPDDYLTPLPQSPKSGLCSTLIHEFGHSLGIVSRVENDVSLSGGKPIFPIDGITRWDSHLYDWRGVQAQAGMPIKLPNGVVSSEVWFDIPNRVFSTDAATYKAPYFSGEHVQELLSNNYLQVYNLIGQKMEQQVLGIPVEGLEGTRSSPWLDLSHIELRNGNMSHQLFRNYNTFMEAELAVLQDIGYTIDRRNFFGYSVYGSGLTLHNTNPFAARNEEGTAYIANTYNNNDFGMGLHVYGSNNTIYQEADLLTAGAAGVGIRVDGVANTISVEPGVRVYADGYNGNGLLVAYGKNHNLTIQQGGVVQAMGEKGIGAAFDFGTNTAELTYLAMRGSYAAWNTATYLVPDINQYVIDVEVDGPLVDTFTVNGALAGTKAAIYMSDNAYVKNVFVGTGAQITGDIINNWVYDDVTLDNMERSKMHRQYTGAEAPVTNLTFAGSGLSYAGNITGKLNTRLSIGEGELTYTGEANVLSATVDKGGTLYGNGTYKLAVPEDSTTHSSVFKINGNQYTISDIGLFTNHGTIGATTGDVNISGDLVSDGKLAVASADNGCKVYLLNVGGSADITNNLLMAGEKDKPLLGKKYNYLTATKGISGNIVTSTLSDYVQATGSVEGNDAFFTATQMKALDDTSGLNANERNIANAFDSTAPNLMQ